jgi:hypothetical protein
MIAHLASLKAQEEGEDEGGGGMDKREDNPEYKDILERGVDLGAGEWL